MRYNFGKVMTHTGLTVGLIQNIEVNGSEYKFEYMTFCAELLVKNPDFLNFFITIPRTTIVLPFDITKYEFTLTKYKTVKVKGDL